MHVRGWVAVVMLLNGVSCATRESDPRSPAPSLPGAPASPQVIEGDGQVVVRWAPPTDSGGTHIIGYRVAWADHSESLAMDVLEFVAVGLSNGQPYTFAVSAENELGVGPASAPSVVATPGGVPGPATGVTATGGAGEATVTWLDADARGRAVTGYTVVSSTGVARTSTGRSATFSGLAPGTYSFFVTAHNALGSGPTSASNVTTVAVARPAIPRSVTATMVGESVRVRWTAPRDDLGGPATGYVVRSVPAGLSANVAGTEAVVSGLTPGLNYKFRVSATNESGEGTASVPSQPVAASRSTSTCTGPVWLGGPPAPFQKLEGAVAVATAQLDDDGFLDLVAIDDGTVHAARGRGDGTFAPHRSVTVAASLKSVGSADMDGDGYGDVVVAGTQGLHVLLGDGTGGLSAPVPHASGMSIRSIVLERIDADARPDVAVLDTALQTITVFLNDGAGGLLPGIVYDVGPDAEDFALADFNHDGWNDLVVATDMTKVVVLVGSADGTFQPTFHMSRFEGRLFNIAVGDFNNDSHLDVFVSAGTSLASLLLGNGDATFSASLVDHRSNFVGAADFNTDGATDLFLFGHGPLRIVLGDGQGGFASGDQYEFGGMRSKAATGDFDDDGRPDVVIANGTSVSLLLNSAAGFRLPVHTASELTSTTALVADDFDLDGHLDVVVAQDSSLRWLRGTGQGSLFPPVIVARTSAFALSSGDFNHDGKPDLAATSNAGLAVLFGNGDGTFQLLVRYRDTGPGTDMSVVDLNADGVSDLVVAASRHYGNHLHIGVEVHIGSADGSFSAPQGHPVPSVSPRLVAADFGSDGHFEVATVNERQNTVTLTENLVTYTQPVSAGANTLAVGERPIDIATADLNGDGLPDIVTANADSRSLSVLIGTQGGGFAQASSVPLGVTVARGLDNIDVGLELLDVTMDGHVDALVPAGSGLMLLTGRGDGTFSAQTEYATNGGRFNLTNGDFNGDGRPDVAMRATAAVVMANQCGP